MSVPGLVLFSLAILAALAYARWQVLRFRENSRKLVSGLTRDCGEEALREISRFGRARIEGDLAEWAGGLERALREYLRERYNLTASELEGEPMSFPARVPGEAESLLRYFQYARYGGALPDGLAAGELESRLRCFIRETSEGSD